MKLLRLAWIIPAIVVGLLSTMVVFAQATNPRHLIATGGGFSQPQDSFYKALESRVASSSLQAVQLLVLPVGIGSNPNSITDAERTAQLAGAEQQRQELEAGCQAYVPAQVTCSAMLVPVITHKDALASPSLEEFSSNPDGIYFLQSDAQSILQVIQGTDLEQEIAAAYQAGSILSGAGELFSRVVIQGYRPKFGPSQAMTFGAVLSTQDSVQGGMAIFPDQAVLDTHPFSENRFGRLLNVITGPSEPHLGIGIESSTGFEFVNDEQILGVFGDSVVAVLDAESYQSANSVTYQPGTDLIGLRNVLVHLVAPGNTTYDLIQRKNSLGTLSNQFSRDFNQLILPPGSGSILLTSNLLENPNAMDILVDFTNLSGGQNAHLLILALGYSDLGSAERGAAQIRQNLEVSSQQILLQPGSGEPIQIDADITGIILIGPDPALIRPEDLLDIKGSWLSGVPILADGAGASLLGAQLPVELSPSEELQPFTPGRYSFQSGFGFIQANIEPNALQNESWERMLTMAYLAPENLVIGIAPGAAIQFTPDKVSVSGTNVVALVDFRSASLSAGVSGTYEVANGLIDLYTPGETLQTILADSQAAPIHAPTPVLEATLRPPDPTPTQTVLAEEILPEPTEAPRGKPPTRTPRPTGTPVPTPPPSDPGTTNLMVFFGVLSVVVVIVGVWLNRQIAVE